MNDACVCVKRPSARRASVSIPDTKLEVFYRVGTARCAGAKRHSARQALRLAGAPKAKAGGGAHRDWRRQAPPRFRDDRHWNVAKTVSAPFGAEQEPYRTGRARYSGPSRPATFGSADAARPSGVARYGTSYSAPAGRASVNHGVWPKAHPCGPTSRVFHFVGERLHRATRRAIGRTVGGWTVPLPRGCRRITRGNISTRLHTARPQRMHISEKPARSFPAERIEGEGRCHRKILDDVAPRSKQSSCDQCPSEAGLGLRPSAPSGTFEVCDGGVAHECDAATSRAHEAPQASPASVRRPYRCPSTVSGRDESRPRLPPATPHAPRAPAKETSPNGPSA